MFERFGFRAADPRTAPRVLALSLESAHRCPTSAACLVLPVPTRTAASPRASSLRSPWGERVVEKGSDAQGRVFTENALWADRRSVDPAEGPTD
jgi:hypothetical protein